MKNTLCIEGDIWYTRYLQAHGCDICFALTFNLFVSSLRSLNYMNIRYEVFCILSYEDFTPNTACTMKNTWGYWLRRHILLDLEKLIDKPLERTYPCQSNWAGKDEDCPWFRKTELSQSAKMCHFHWFSSLPRCNSRAHVVRCARVYFLSNQSISI